MSALGRRGYTLVELIIALVLLGIVSGAIYQVLVNNQRVYQAQTRRTCAPRRPSCPPSSASWTRWTETFSR